MLHRFRRTQRLQSRKVCNGQPAPMSGENTPTAQGGQFPSDLDPAHAQNISQILLGHGKASSGTCRLSCSQQIQQIAQLHLGGIEFLVDDFKQESVHIFGIPADYAFGQSLIGFKHFSELENGEFQDPDFRKSHGGQGQFNVEILRMVSRQNRPRPMETDDFPAAAFMVGKMHSKPGFIVLDPVKRLARLPEILSLPESPPDMGMGPEIFGKSAEIVSEIITGHQHNKTHSPETGSPLVQRSPSDSLKPLQQAEIRRNTYAA